MNKQMLSHYALIGALVFAAMFFSWSWSTWRFHTRPHVIVIGEKKVDLPPGWYLDSGDRKSYALMAAAARPVPLYRPPMLAIKVIETKVVSPEIKLAAVKAAVWFDRREAAESNVSGPRLQIALEAPLCMKNEDGSVACLGALGGKIVAATGTLDRDDLISFLEAIGAKL